jgi:hypothetical protein
MSAGGKVGGFDQVLPQYFSHAALSPRIFTSASPVAPASCLSVCGLKTTEQARFALTTTYLVGFVAHPCRSRANSNSTGMIR